ncbi:SRPBCC family protein [Kitasatospora sp. NPDC001159]
MRPALTTRQRRRWRAWQTSSETLLAYDEEARSYTYSLPDDTFHFDDYRAVLRVSPVTELDASFVKWSVTYDIEPEHRKESADRVHGVFTSGLVALREHFAN